MERKIFSKIVVLVVIVLAIGFFIGGICFWKRNRSSFKTIPVVTSPVALVASDVLDGQGFVVTSNLLKKIVDTQDPTAAFSALQAALIKDPKLAVLCHELTHVIGNEAYLKYGSFQAAMKFNNYMCGSGYIHSLVIGALKGVNDPSMVINSICAGQDGYCYHGIGHGLMFFTNNDVPQALTYCAKLDTAEQAARCSEGVFMQNFEAGGDDPAPYVYPNDPLKLCRDEPRFKTACYIYAGEYLATDWKTTQKFFDQCDASDPGFVSKCISGMGAYLMAVHLDDPKKAEQMCDTGKTGTIKDACIDGMVSYDLVNYNSIPKTEALCASLATGNQATCNASLAARKPYYQ